MKIVNVRDARENFAQVIDDAQGEPIVLTRLGRPAAIIVGVLRGDSKVLLDEVARLVEEPRRRRR